jgi:hypothetical protein
VEQEWWYAETGQKIGPIPLSDLLQCLGRGQITGDTLVWQPGWKDWRKLMDVEAIRNQVLEALKEQNRRIPPSLPSEGTQPSRELYENPDHFAWRVERIYSQMLGEALERKKRRAILSNNTGTVLRYDRRRSYLIDVRLFWLSVAYTVWSYWKWPF